MDYLVLVDTQEAVEAFNPDMHRLAQVDTRGVIVTAPSTSNPPPTVSSSAATPSL